MEFLFQATFAEIHKKPNCVIVTKEVLLNSKKTDPSTGDLLPVSVLMSVCETHNVGVRPLPEQLVPSL